jgi:hypothetical protein
MISDHEGMAMNRLLSVVSAFLLIAGIFGISAAAQETDLNAIFRRFQELHAAGNYPAALREAEKYEAVVKSRFGTNHVNYASALGSLALVHKAQGKYAEAQA